MAKFNRLEAKYLIPRSTRTALTAALHPFMMFDPLASGENGTYVLQSLYFDSPTRVAYYEKLDGVDLFAQFQPGGAARLALLGRFSDAIDYANNQPADEQLLNPQLELKLGRHVNANLDHRFQKLDVEGGTLFEANLSQLRLVYNFSTRMFVRGIFQWLDVSRDPDLYGAPVESETETLFTQLLFSYTVNARTVLFLGYSDNQLGLEDVAMTRTDRTVFFKVGYAWIL